LDNLYLYVDMAQFEKIYNEDLRKWFNQKWVNIGKKVDGKHPPCGTSGEKSGYAKCVPAAKAAGMSKKEKESATRRKRDAQNDAGRGGSDSKGQGKKPIYVSTKPKNETMNIEEKLNLFLEKNCPTDPDKWSASKAAAKSKFDVYPSAYANGWAAKNYKEKGGGWKTCSENIVNEAPNKLKHTISKKEWSKIPKYNKHIGMDGVHYIMKYDDKIGTYLQGVQIVDESVNEACWDGYKQVGMKDKGGKQVPNCVPIGEDINSDDDVNYGLVEPEEEYDVDNYDDMVDFIKYMRGYTKELNEGCSCLTEAEYQGRNVQLGKPMAGDVKKFKVYVKNPAGNVVKVNFGQKGVKIKKNNPERRKSFRARHNCENPGPRHKARYWSCRKW